MNEDSESEEDNEDWTISEGNVFIHEVRKIVQMGGDDSGTKYFLVAFKKMKDEKLYFRPSWIDSICMKAIDPIMTSNFYESMIFC